MLINSNINSTMIDILLLDCIATNKKAKMNPEANELKSSGYRFIFIISPSFSYQYMPSAKASSHKDDASNKDNHHRISYHSGRGVW